MDPMTHRREFLQATVLLSTLLASGNAAFAAKASAARRFDYAWLKGQARALAQRAYRPAPKVLHQRLIDLGYDEYQALRFRREHALWGKVVREAGIKLD